jgi:hypothetical protein
VERDRNDRDDTMEPVRGEAESTQLKYATDLKAGDVSALFEYGRSALSPDSPRKGERAATSPARPAPQPSGTAVTTRLAVMEMAGTEDLAGADLVAKGEGSPAGGPESLRSSVIGVGIKQVAPALEAVSFGDVQVAPS